MKIENDNTNSIINTLIEASYEEINQMSYDLIADYFKRICPIQLFSSYDGTSELNDEEIFLFEDMDKENYDKLVKLVMKYYIWK